MSLKKLTSASLLSSVKLNLGWLVVLGSGRKRIADALAFRHRSVAFGSGRRAAQRSCQLDNSFGNPHLLAQSHRYVPGPIGRADERACLCARSGPRHIHFGPDRACDGRRLDALCNSSPEAESNDALFDRQPGERPDFEQCASQRACFHGLLGDLLSSLHRHHWQRQNLGRSALLYSNLCAARHSTLAGDGDRPGAQMEARCGAPGAAAVAACRGCRLGHRLSGADFDLRPQPTGGAFHGHRRLDRGRLADRLGPAHSSWAAFRWRPRSGLPPIHHAPFTGLSSPMRASALWWPALPA